MRWKEREGGGGSRVCFMFACHDAQRFSTIRPTLVGHSAECGPSKQQKFQGLLSAH